MASQRITIRISQALGKRLKKHAGMEGRSESEIVREALESYLRRGSGQSAYELASQAGLVGCLRGAPRDLSTNPRHFKGFGEKR
ncbi:MAG: CopG family transcriptional regulator [Acidobacteriales bacterium]|nr:CopG family transcriptional regulator [Candidatus Koribacter versatilis]MBI3645990.1 CopG family transcriptional regulator [Terriglobales bacterium]